MRTSFWEDDAMKKPCNDLPFVTLPALLALLMLAGCGPSPAAPAASARVPTGGVKDTTWFVKQLQARGATVTLLKTYDQTLLFPAPLRLFQVNHAQVSVYEYANERAAQTEAAKISPGGDRIGNAVVDWWMAPHFYQVGKLIVLYVGSERPTLALLGSILGAPCAEGHWK
jgi:hypothetical protein